VKKHFIVQKFEMKSSFQDNALGMFLSNFLKWFTFTFDRFDATTAGIATKD